jgi:hypothetical protein
MSKRGKGERGKGKQKELYQKNGFKTPSFQDGFAW